MLILLLFFIILNFIIIYSSPLKKDYYPFIAGVNLTERFNEETKNGRNYASSRISSINENANDEVEADADARLGSNMQKINKCSDSEKIEENISDSCLNASQSSKKNNNNIINNGNNSNNSNNTNMNTNTNINDNNFIDNSKNMNFIKDSTGVISKILKIYEKSKKTKYTFESINSNLMEIFPFEESQEIKIQKDSSALIYQNEKSNIGLDKKALIKCTCKSSKCLKFYCDCFRNGKLCSNCSCLDCKNKKDYEKLILEKYNQIVLRNPKALQQIYSTKKSWTCKCKNSFCTKNYCDCYQNGRRCTTKCKCTDCKNKKINNKNQTQNKKMTKHIKGKKGSTTNKRKAKPLEENEAIKGLFTPKKKKKICFNENDDYAKNICTATVLKVESTAELTENINKKRNIFRDNNKKPNNIFQKLDVDNI